MVRGPQKQCSKCLTCKYTNTALVKFPDRPIQSVFFQTVLFRSVLFSKTKTNTKTRTECLNDPIYAIFDKLRIQGYQISHFEQSTGQIFADQPDNDTQGQLPAPERAFVHLKLTGK